MSAWKMGVVMGSFKFRVKHTRGTDKLVAEAHSLAFRSMPCEGLELMSAALIESLLLLYSSIQQYQYEDPLCNNLYVKIEAGQAAAEKIVVHKDLICYFPENAKGRI